MSDHAEKKENRLEAESSADEAAELSTGPDVKVDDGESADDTVDFASELDGVLDEDDDYQEIDLFDEGLLDDDSPSPQNADSDAAGGQADGRKVPESAGDAAGAVDSIGDSGDVDEVLTGISDDIAADLSSPLPDRESDESTDISAEEVSVDEVATTPDSAESAETGAQGTAAAPDAETAEENPAVAEYAEGLDERGPDIQLEPVESSEHMTPEEAGTEPQESSDTDHDAFDDDIGISLSDDELWGDSAEDEGIPLFDDEPEGENTVDDDVSVEELPAGESIAPSESHGDTGTPEQEEGERKAQASEYGEQDEDDLIVIGGFGPSWVSWILSGLAACVLIGGIFVLWGMLTTPSVSAVSSARVLPQGVKSSMSGVTQQDSGTHGPAAGEVKATALQDIAPVKGRPSLEAFRLAPFIIPVQRQGELVFFKLTVELIVPDMKTKQALKKREAWVRDAIYTELKGIDVGPGAKGEFLLNYRRPLKKRIEKDLAPVEIRDVRLMGYVLK